MASIIRNPNESFSDYKERRLTQAEADKQARKPKVVWDSFYQGTYIKSKHGEI